MVGTGGQCEVVGTGGQCEVVGTGGQCEVVGTGGQCEVVGTGGGERWSGLDTLCCYSSYIAMKPSLPNQ